MKLLTFILIALLLVTILVVALVISLKASQDKCLANPLVYASEKYTELYGYEFIGYAWLDTPINVNSPKFSFNSKNLSIS